MAKRYYYQLTLKRLAQRLKVGRGRGTGPDYRPFVTVFDLSSIGNSHRVWSWLCQRIVHLFSDNENILFKLIQANPLVVDIREQFPLLPYQEIQRIAKIFDEKYFQRLKKRVLNNGEIYVPTSDFRVTAKSPGGLYDFIITVKPSTKLTAHQLLKFTIEREFWRRRNLQFFIVTDQDLQKNHTLYRNIRFLKRFRNLERNQKIRPENINEKQKIEAVNYLTEAVVGQTVYLSPIVRETDEKFNFWPGTSVVLANHLVATNMWQVDLINHRYNPSRHVHVQQANIDAFNC